MKKTFLILILLISVFDLSAQSSSNIPKGIVRFKFNQSDIEGPIASVIIRKENNVIISFSARLEFGDLTDDIHINFAVLDLKPGATVIEDYSAFDYESEKKDPKNNELLPGSIRFSSRGNSAHYSTKFSSFEYPKSPTKIFLDEVSFKDGKLKIKGRFEGIYTSPEENSLNISKCEIKDGRFEIIL